MSDSKDKSNTFREHRFNFHSFVAENAGSSEEYVHGKILSRIGDLLEKTNKAAILNPNDINHLALSTLQQCSAAVLASLKLNASEEQSASFKP